MNTKNKVIIIVSAIISIILLIVFWESISPLLEKIIFFLIGAVIHIAIGAFILYVILFAVVPICNELLKKLNDL